MAKKRSATTSPGSHSPVSLEAAILAATHGHSPDRFWAGSTSAECFMRMVGDLIQLLTHRESGEGSMVAKQVAPEEFRCDYPLPRGVEQPTLFTLHHSVRLMIMAASARFLLGRQSQTFFSSSTWIPYERLATFPPSCYQLTDSELRFVQAHLPRWPEQLQFRLSAFFSQPAGSNSSTLGTVRRLSTILSSFQVQTCPIIKYNPSGV
jgi:hypothetical protein